MAEKKLNICLVSREYPPDTAFGGIATYSLDTAKLLIANGHQVTVFSQSLTPSHIATIDGIPVHKIRIPRPFDSYSRLPLFILAYNFMMLQKIQQLHQQHPFDIIDVPDHLAEGLFALFFPDIPVVTRLHTPYSLLVDMGLNNYKKRLSYYLIKYFEKIALRRSNALYAPTMDLIRRCDELLGLENIPYEIFGYPIDLELFSPKQTQTTALPRRILFLGRLEQRKGIETIAHAFPGIFSQYPDASITIIGNDTPHIQGFSSGREYIKKHFEPSNCAGSANFLSAVSLEKLPELFRSHDIVWVPSLYDNFPLICLEAMACGKAVVVSDAGGLPEMVHNGETGLIFKKGDADDLIRKTIILFTQPDLARNLGRNARIYCEQNYATQTIYENNMSLYQKAINNLKDGKR